jgi:hypothetical protein
LRGEQEFLFSAMTTCYVNIWGPSKSLKSTHSLAEFKDEFVGGYHDGTTYLSEAFCIILRCVKKDFSIILRLVKLAFLEGSMNNTQISRVSSCIAMTTHACLIRMGKHLKAGGTALEGDGFECIKACDTLVGMGEHLKSSMSSHELMSELVQVVEANGGTADASLFCGRNRDRVASAAEILRSLTIVQGVMVSINSDWWDWEGAKPPQARYKGRIVKWHSKDQGTEQLSISWEFGMVSGIMQQGYAPPEKADLSKASVRGGKALTESKYFFQLEPYENGAPAPTQLQKDVSVADASPFLLANPDFSKMEVVKAYTHRIVAPAIDY